MNVCMTSMRKAKWHIVWLTVCLMMAVAITGSAQLVQDFTYNHLGQAEGMWSQRVYSIQQTQDGAIWWATKRGVERYNGATIRHYELGDGSIFSSFAGRTIRLTRHDATLFAHDNKGCIYAFDEVLDRFEPVADLNKLMSGEVLLNDVAVTDEGMWLAMYQGVYLLKGDQLTALRQGLWTNCIIPTRFGLYFGTKQGLYDKQLKQVVATEVETGYYDQQYNNVWLGGFDNGIGVLSLDEHGAVVGQEFFSVGTQLQQSPIRSFCPYDDTTMLIGIDGLGVYAVSRNTPFSRCELLFDANEGRHGVLHGNGIYSIVKDRWQNIVIGSYSGGIDIARPVGSTMAVFEHVRDNLQTVANDRVNCVVQRGDQLLMGTDNGISILNTTSGMWQHTCQGVVVIDLFKTDDGRVLASTFGNGVYEVNAAGAARQLYNVAGGILKDDHVYASCIDQAGNLWMGCLYGDLVMTGVTGTHYYRVDNVQCILQLPSGEMAVGTANGIKLVAPDREEINELVYSPQGTDEVNRYVVCMYVNQGRELWIGTDGGGVYVYDLQSQACRQLTTQQGLPSNCVCSLTAGDDGRIWIATEQGLAFVAPREPDKAVDVNYCYGLAREYSSCAVARLDNGDILLGSTTGAVIINPKEVHAIDYTTRLHIRGVSCGDDDNDKFREQVQRMLDNDVLYLPYDKNTFDLYYESINLRYQFDIAYRYRVGDDEWSQLTDQQYIHFTNLAPGTHRLVLCAVSRTSGVVLDEKTLVITIAQPWWNSWWMWCFYVALVGLAFYGAWRIYQLHNKYMRLTIDYLQLSQNDSPSSVPLMDSLPSVPLKDLSPSVLPEDSPTSIPHKEGEARPSTNTGGLLGDGKDFVDRATKHIVEHLSESDFTIDKLCREMMMSRTLFYVKLKSYTGKSPQDFIRVIRLERAAVLLRNGSTVTDTASLTGFDNPKYFSTVFKKYFGVTPSKYRVGGDDEEV